MSNKPQSYASHAKLDPPFHFFVLPVLLINILVVGLSPVSPSWNWRRHGYFGFGSLARPCRTRRAVGPPTFRTV